MDERTLDHSRTTNETDVRDDVRSSLVETAKDGLQSDAMKEVMESAVNATSLVPVNEAPASADEFVKRWEDSLAAA